MVTLSGALILCFQCVGELDLRKQDVKRLHLDLLNMPNCSNVWIGFVAYLLKGQSEMDVQTIPIEAVGGMLTKDEIWLGGEEEVK